MNFFRIFHYYLVSFFLLLKKTNFILLPLSIFKKPFILKVKKGNTQFFFYVRSLMDIWVIKEVILDNQYQQFKKIRKGDVVIDIGASIGDFSILADKYVIHGKVLSFEIDHLCIKLFKKNIILNKSKNIFVYQEKVTSLNKLFKKYKIDRCDFLKIDCEGCEYEIFKNISPTVLSKINYIAMEIHLFNDEMKKEYQQLKKILLRNQFMLKEVANPVHNYLKFLFAQKKFN